MNHIYDLANAQLEQASMVTIGVFDGVHRGHQHLITRLVTEAHASDRLAVALTFFPHPDVVIRGLKNRHYLMSAEERADHLMRLGVDYVITHPFNDAVRQIRAADFVDRLIHHLKLEALWVGADFAMGFRREGDVEFLRQEGAKKGFMVETVEMVLQGNDGRVISSSEIRQLLHDGRVDDARTFLGRGFSVCGKVVHGEKRGRKIGFPTANLALWDEQVVPANGVYAGWAMLDDERLMAMINVGIRPTFEGDDVTVEAHLLDFDRQIYGENLTLIFEHHLRAEKKFSGIDPLIEQIRADIQAGRAYLLQNS